MHLRFRIACKSRTATSQIHVRRNVTTNTAPRMTQVEKLVRDSIKATGPMSVSTYMQFCLSHPTHGYYMNPDNPVFGKAGDFITSPEISQVFGELIAIWHLSRWLAAGQPPRIRIIELGPGRGTLAADALRTWAQFPAARAALKNGGTLHLVETSDAMRRLQGETLKRSGVLGQFENSNGNENGGFVRWHGALEDVRASQPGVDKDTFTVVVAHEFFDALPVHILERTKDGWHEIQITTSPDSTAKTLLTSSSTSSPQSTPQTESESESESNLPPLRLVRNPESTTLSSFLGSLSPRYTSVPNGARLEVSPTNFKLARTLAELVNDPQGAGGSALIIDYGRDVASGKSLRVSSYLTWAFKKHKIVDIFETPGECDLTANVDFALLKEAISSTANSYGPLTQRDFLINMGIDARVLRLSASKAGTDKEGKEEIVRAAKRLIDPTGMGVQYKVLGVTGTGAREAGEKEREEVWPFVMPAPGNAKSGETK
ncbi:DUF185-domain-containing protein [Fomitiporia mediterranea MF3/22]|uniref:DUF185-domain-containing protein n=1 Tax=Fomitiporia mediterranea (strain MF3/22) TaxID=694068 RepID=UPI0004409B61|nr:DUF185-domain-containing protein [Fomitiporia mediterranea MF3/22]EJD06897.1 DUF185-domain-containing protein [Fomitiporia mediterranea MF3/22]